MKHSAKHIADRIRLMIATKQFQMGEAMPSTRELGKQLEASFHTVRKAYQSLEQEGLLEGRVGVGFIVKRQSTLLDKSARLEMGAEKMRAVIEELIGYGLDEGELETLFEEQLLYQEWPNRIQRSVVIAETEEIANMHAEAIKREVGVRAEAMTITSLDPSSPKVHNYDALFIPIHLFNPYRVHEDELRLIPMMTQFEQEALLMISERLNNETLGLVTTQEATLPYLLQMLKSAVQIEGSFVAGATYGKSLPLFVRNCDVIVHTTTAAKLVESKYPSSQRIALRYTLSEKTKEMIRSEYWD
ncbi:MAG: GntR family transcriptional regulator [Rhodothermaeota bacterium MED-G64]|nr:MAG: GntR family transcriptional regulator [Rhodothermaeota bacterium MED-G64]RPF81408.1 MAG: GntR family transcriptional regulator [Rhodothermaceae bacterium TMED105]|tara:strand:- start:4770 stop:5672 length:903 start_codon:yes stop_codon:yes gene_type:complete